MLMNVQKNQVVCFHFFFFKEVCLRRSCILDVTKIATLVFNAVYLNINITCALDRMPHYLH